MAGKTYAATIHLACPLPDMSCNQPGWQPGADQRLPSCHPYSVLLPVGFAVPLALPQARWALTPPFHPCRTCPAVCSLWHCPWGHPRRTLSGTVLLGARTFLSRSLSACAGAVARPTDGRSHAPLWPRGQGLATERAEIRGKPPPAAQWPRAGPAPHRCAALRSRRHTARRQSHSHRRTWPAHSPAWAGR